MPPEIALLPMVESAFNPNAMSVARAAGMWQFMPSTGRHFGLKQNWWFDARRDVLAATTSALDYLQKLYDEFGDWQLALAAYNWGEGNVRRAVARNKAKGLADRLREPDRNAGGDPELRAEAAGGEEHRHASPQKYGLSLGGRSRRAVLHGREDDAQDGREARGRARRAAAGRLPRAQSRSTTAR